MKTKIPRSLTLLVATICVLTFAYRLILHAASFRNESWLLFSVGSLIAAPLLLWVIPRTSKGSMKHILRGLVCLLFIGPSLSPPDGIYLPFLATFCFFPSFYLSGYGLLFAIDAFLISIAACSASIAWELDKAAAPAV